MLRLNDGICTQSRCVVTYRMFPSSLPSSLASSLSPSLPPFPSCWINWGRCFRRRWAAAAVIQVAAAAVIQVAAAAAVIQVAAASLQQHLRSHMAGWLMRGWASKCGQGLPRAPGPDTQCPSRGGPGPPTSSV